MDRKRIINRRLVIQVEVTVTDADRLYAAHQCGFKDIAEFLADAQDPDHPEAAQDLLDSYAAEHKSRQSQAELVLNGIGIKILSDDYEADDNPRNS